MLRHRHPGAVLALAALAALPVTAGARQEPKPGNAWYEDEVDLGFKVKAPKDWGFVPGRPLDRNLVGSYAASNGNDVPLGHNAIVTVTMFLVKFDRRAKANEKEGRQIGDQKVEFAVQGCKDIDEWISKGLDQGKEWRAVEQGEVFKGALEGRRYLYEGLSTIYVGTYEPQPIRAYAVVFPLSSEVDVALVGLGPGDKKKWRTFESAYATLAKTLQPIATVAGTKEPTGKDPRSLKRAKLEADVAKSPGWSLYETPNYFIVSCYDDKAFIEELKLRLEAIRTVYEKDYPPELARKVKVQPKAGAGGATAPDQEPEDPTRTEGVVDTLELGKCSVVRLCKDREQYLQYGGSSRSSGYFSSAEAELVVYDDKQDEGRDATWGVLNHEGFHQYIYAFFGNLSPHSWYNEGTGDYYSGFEFNVKTKKFKAEKEIGRQDNLLLIRDNYVPLKDFVRWSQAQYYGTNSGGIKGDGVQLDGWACYAQGWSMIWFLRTGEAGKAKGWKKEWGGILEKYLLALLETGDVNKAADRAFEGVDWDALQASWADYMM